MFHLHVTAKDRWQLTLWLPRSGRFLGLFPRRGYDLNMAIDSIDESVGLLRLFYASNVDQLVTEAKKKPCGEAQVPTWF